MTYGDDHSGVHLSRPPRHNVTGVRFRTRHHIQLAHEPCCADVVRTLSEREDRAEGNSHNGSVWRLESLQCLAQLPCSTLHGNLGLGI